MSFANRHNTKKAHFEVDTTNFEFKSLAQLKNEYDDEVHKILGAYINTKSKYGNAPVVITDNCFVNLPKHLLETFLKILESDEDVADINNGKVGFKIRTYSPKGTNSVCYTIDFVDM